MIIYKKVYSNTSRTIDRNDLDIANRTKETKNIYYTLKNNIEQKRNRQRIKTESLQYYSTTNQPTYASENWTLNKNDENKITVVNMPFLRKT